MTRLIRTRARIRRLYANPAALGYLALVAAAGLFAVGDHLATDRPDASLSGIWVIALTLPTSLVFLAADGGWGAVGLALSALFQAALLGAGYRWLTRRRSLVDDA